MYDLIFKNFSMHVQLDPEEQELIRSRLVHQVIKKNEHVLDVGKTCKNVCFVTKGCLRLYNIDKEGLAHNIMFYTENWWAADLASFSMQRPAAYAISALEETEVLCLAHDILEQLYVEVPKLERFFRILIQNGFSLYQGRINASLSKTAEKRYSQFQRQYPKLEQRIAQKHIASYLGITPVFLSMLRKRNFNKISD
jgi:CRP-like cAMP-binding protein